MKTIYLLKHIQSHHTEVVATFTDPKKAEKAFDIFCQWREIQYPKKTVEQSSIPEKREHNYRSFHNGHIVRIEESRLCTDLEDFRKYLDI